MTNFFLELASISPVASPEIDLFFGGLFEFLPTALCL
jgi:hypothetical protein